MMVEEKSVVAPCVGQGGRVENMGASTLKWTGLDPCLVFIENDSKLYTKYFEFCGEKNHRHVNNIFTYKAKKFMMTKNSKKVYIF
jgi:hypothetical protein